MYVLQQYIYHNKLYIRKTDKVGIIKQKNFVSIRMWKKGQVNIGENQTRTDMLKKQTRKCTRC